METVFEVFDDNTANIISFNQDYSIVSMGTERGYKIIQLAPIIYHEKNLSGSLERCEMSYKSNFLALVGGGKIPKYNNTKVVLYNDAEDCIECEYKFATPVLNVKFKKNLIFIVCEKKIYVFNVQTSQNIDSFDTITNKKGLIAVNGSPEKTIMAHPIQFEDDPDKGYVGIKNYKTNKYFPLLVNDEPPTYMEMDYNGLLLATVNDKGTVIKIHNLADKTLVYELRRGKDKATINYISFDLEYNYVGVTSNKGTIHIWKLNDIIEKTKVNDNEVNYKVKKINSYKSELSFAKIKINKANCIFCFKSNDRVLIISPDEKCYISNIDKKGGYFTAEEKKDLTVLKEK